MDQDQGKAVGKVIAKAWADEGFKARLLADPAAVLAAEGLQTPAGVTLKVLENTAGVFNLVLPARPAELSDSDLDQVAGGGLCTAGHGPLVFPMPKICDF